jgi:ATP-binding cassette, subfamily B, bacterial
MLILISHRFSTVRKADKIIVLENGRIIEEGDHKTLLKNKKIYAELFEAQAKNYR